MSIESFVFFVSDIMFSYCQVEAVVNANIRLGKSDEDESKMKLTRVCDGCLGGNNSRTRYMLIIRVLITSFSRKEGICVRKQSLSME